MRGGRRGSGGDFGRLEALLAEAGLGMPPMPEGVESRLKERAERCFSTRAHKESPTNLLHYVRKAIGGISPDYVLVAHAGEGTDPQALHYYLAQGPLQIFLRMSWSGATDDRALGPLAECLALTHDLVAAVPRALEQGKLGRTGRITVVATDLGDSFWEVAPSGSRADPEFFSPRRKGRESPKPRQVLAEAAAWCRA